jgi:hypothetical protein
MPMAKAENLALLGFSEMQARVRMRRTGATDAGRLGPGLMVSLFIPRALK